MPAIEINTAERQYVQTLAQITAREMEQLSLEGKLVFAIEMSRILAPQIAELKKRAEGA
jgi:hypothetical protein